VRGGFGGEVHRPLIGAGGVGMRGQGALPFSSLDVCAELGVLGAFQG